MAGTTLGRLLGPSSGVLIAALIGAGAGTAGEAPRLALPVDCDMGTVCMVHNYADNDDGPDARDFACGDLTYDGHEGTDFLVSDLPAMKRGIAVRAAASGVVRATRDGMRDVDVREIGQFAVTGRETGNGVVIDHGGGWETRYDHLRRRSVAVGPGVRVVAGQRLGLIGMSGNARFPHLHFEVRFEGRAIDPFVGIDGPGDCGLGVKPLWSRAALEALPYTPTGLIGAGFAPEAPDVIAARRGDYAFDGLPSDASAIAFWVRVYGVRPGDIEVARLTAPDGAVIAKKRQVRDRYKSLWFSFVGRKRGDAAWPAGAYRGEYRLLREIDGERRLVLSAVREIDVR